MHTLAYVCAFLLLIRSAWALLIRYIEDQYCAAGDIRPASQPRQGNKLGARAVIIGASISGLLAARVCATHYDEVILLDAEECTTDPTIKRTRVKQHSQLHLFLALLAPALDSLFPSFRADFARAGGSYAAPASNSYRAGGFTRLPDSGWTLEQLYISRETFEALLRKLVLGIPAIRAQVGTVTRLIPSADRRTISAVLVRRADGKTKQLYANLVIDASGTTNGSISWLRREGYREPVKRAYDPRLRYTCMTWQLMPATIAKFDALAAKEREMKPWRETGHLGSAFIGDHASSFMRIDGNRVRCLFQTILDDGREVHTTEEMREAIHAEPYKPSSLAALDIVWNAERDDGAPPPECKNVNIGVCYRVDFDTRDMPCNLLPLGDTITRVNPIFGQGCTKAMIDALCLDRALRRTTPGNASSLAARFLDLHEKRTKGMWRAVKTHDYGLITTVPLLGETLELGVLQRRVSAWILRASHRDATVGAQLTRTTGQLDSFLALWSPGFLLRCAMVNAGLL